MKKFFKAFPEKYPKLWEFIKFVFTAFSTTILYYIVFWIGQATLVEPLKDVEVHSSILKFLGYDENLGLAISYLLASFLSYAASYIMNRKVTFKSNSNVLVSTILFALMVVVTTAFTAWFGTFATNWAQAQGGFWASGFVSSLLIPTVAMLIPFVWTFPFQKYVIYRNKKPVEGEQAQEAETAKEAEEVKEVEDTKETEEVPEAQAQKQAAQKDSE
ncbi:MAG: hypothetical protein IKE65_06865 [Clostridia bacterium]|nr:hypothetical protein [Clostridia bacterium]